MAEVKRKLSKPMRRMNLAYKIIMALLAGVSFILATLTDTHEIYYQVVSVFSSAFPVIWSQVLDACKDYEAQQRPEVLSPASTSVRFSERNTPKPDDENNEEVSNNEK